MIACWSAEWVYANAVHNTCPVTTNYITPSAGPTAHGSPEPMSKLCTHNQGWGSGEDPRVGQAGKHCFNILGSCMNMLSWLVFGKKASWLLVK
jgi:hypothetical protein